MAGLKSFGRKFQWVSQGGFLPRRTVLEPKNAYTTGILIRDALRKGDQTDDLSVGEFAEYADQGHASMAYTSGIGYKNRLLGATDALGAIDMVVTRAP